MKPESYDVIFLGGGLASNLVARYLKLKFKDFRILVLEKNIKAHSNPGESTVGVTGLFLIRDLGLSTYCYLNHLPKNGLRYFFRDAAKSFELTKCSEIGSNILPIFPTYQVDRARLDTDLWDLNREIGIDVITGAEVSDVNIGSNGESHQLTYRFDDKKQKVKCTWLLNSSGRGSRAAPIFEELNPAAPDGDLFTAAAWGRFENVVDIDSLGDERWRARVGFTSRYLSTNHIMGQGYWIWVIPIDRGVVSFGVVYDKNVLGKTIDDPDQFQSFLNTEPLIATLLQDSRRIDFQSHPHISFRRSKFCDPNRWAVIGDSLGFIDPFYSPGSDIISRQAYLIEHLIQAKNQEELVARCELLNQYTAFEFEIIKLLYHRQYEGFESFEVFNIKSLWDFHSYTNRMVWNFLNRNFTDLDWIQREVDAADRSLQLTRAIQNGFRDFYLYLKANNLQKRHNLENYSLRQNRFQIEEEMLVSYSDERSVEEHLYLCRLSISELMESRFQMIDFKEHKLSQDLLTFSSISSFELSEVWLAKLLHRIGRRMSLLLRQKINVNLEIQIHSSDYARAFPKCLETQNIQIREEGTRIWSEKTYNSVLNQLKGKKERKEHGPSWKDHTKL